MTTVDSIVAYLQTPQFLTIAAVSVTVAVASHLLLRPYLFPSAPPSILDPTTYRPFPLIARTDISHNTRRFRFGLPDASAPLGLPIGQHVSLRAVLPDGSDVKRPYTPTSSDRTARGYFELVVKVYPEPHGLMSRYLDGMKVGDAIDVRGPSGRFEYSPNRWRTLGMICGGTGLTPMWQVFQEILANPDDVTRVNLIYANVTDDDILLRQEIQEAADKSDGQLSVYFVLNNPPDQWTGGVGFVSQAHIEQQIGLPEDGKHVLLCGPPPMNKAMKGHLAAIGFPPESVFQF